jgi:hypothetical protein
MEVEMAVLAHKKFAITLLDMKGDLSVARQQFANQWLTPFIVDDSNASAAATAIPSIDVIVFPVDSTSTSTIAASKQLLADLVNDLSTSPVLNKNKKKVSILIVANKQDDAGAMDCDALTKELSISSLSASVLNKVEILPFSCGAASDNSNNKLVLKWIMKQSPHYKKKLKLAKTLKKWGFK